MVEWLQKEVGFDILNQRKPTLHYRRSCGLWNFEHQTTTISTFDASDEGI